MKKCASRIIDFASSWYAHETMREIFIYCHVKLGVSMRAVWLIKNTHIHICIYDARLAEETSSFPLVTCLYSAIRNTIYNTVVWSGAEVRVSRDARAWHYFVKQFCCAIASMSTFSYETVRDITRKKNHERK